MANTDQVTKERTPEEKEYLELVKKAGDAMWAQANSPQPPDNGDGTSMREMLRKHRDPKGHERRAIG